MRVWLKKNMAILPFLVLVFALMGIPLIYYAIKWLESVV